MRLMQRRAHTMLDRMADGSVDELDVRQAKAASSGACYRLEAEDACTAVPAIHNEDQVDASEASWMLRQDNQRNWSKVMHDTVKQTIASPNSVVPTTTAAHVSHASTLASHTSCDMDATQKRNHALRHRLAYGKSRIQAADSPLRRHDSWKAPPQTGTAELGFDLGLPSEYERKCATSPICRSLPRQAKDTSWTFIR